MDSIEIYPYDISNNKSVYDDKFDGKKVKTQVEGRGSELCFYFFDRNYSNERHYF